MDKEMMIKFVIPAGLATLVLLFFIIMICSTFFKRTRNKRHLKDLEKKFSYLKGLLTGQDSQNVRRLETISRSNLLYGDIYEKYSYQFKNILDKECKYADGALSKLRAIFVRKDYRNFKNMYHDAKKAILAFEDAILAFDKSLYDILKPEEECRSECVKIKELFRTVKQKVIDSKESLTMVLPVFDKVYVKVDAQFAKFEELLDCADYQEANDLLPNLMKVTTALDHAVDVLPMLCSQIEKVIPEKIMLLGSDVFDIEKKGLPLFHLAYKKKADFWGEELIATKEQLKELKIGGAQETLNKISNEIDEMHRQLDQEISDKAFFEANVNAAYENVLELEQRFLKIVSILPKLNSIYVVSVTQQNNLEVLKNNINELGIAKRSLDNFIHSSTKQPFSVLKAKLDQLVSDYQIAKQGVEDFNAYIESIKTNSEDAYKLVFSYYYRLKQAEYMIRELNIPSLQEGYSESIETCYNLLNIIDDTVKTQPIDVNFVNQKVEELKTISKDLFDGLEKKINDMNLAESAIIYNNNDRLHQSDVHEKLSLLEEDFFQGEFDKVYQAATEIYKSKHVEDKK